MKNELEALRSRQKTIQINNPSYLQYMIDTSYLPRWINDMWTYCQVANMPDEVAYISLQIFVKFANTQPPTFVQDRWISHTCIWIACKLFFDHQFKVRHFVEKVKGRVSRHRRKKYVRKMVSHEFNIVRALGYEFHKPMPIDFVNAIVPLLGLTPGSKVVLDIRCQLRKITNMDHITLSPVDVAVQSILLVNPRFEEKVHNLLS